MKKSYNAPTFQDLGSFESLTKAAGMGDFTDAQFPNNTPFSELTFS